MRTFRTTIHRNNLNDLRNEIVKKEAEGYECVHPFKKRTNISYATKDVRQVYWVTMEKKINE